MDPAGLLSPLMPPLKQVSSKSPAGVATVVGEHTAASATAACCYG
jgi:hypothetical protein